MNCLYSLVSTQLNLEQNSDDHIYAYAESVLYLCGCTPAFKYQKLIKPFCESVSAKKFRLMIQDSRYTNLTLKLFTLRLSIDRHTRRHQANKLGAVMGVHTNDVRVVSDLFLKNEWFSKELNRRTRRIPHKHIHLTEAGVIQTFNAVFPHVHKYIKHIVFKKMRFLVKSTNTDFVDYQSDIAAKVVQSFYSMVPVLNTPEYIINYLKRSAHNHAINIIKAETSQKRGRLINVGQDRNNENQFSLLCVSENQTTPTLDEEGNVVSVDHADENTCASKVELRYAILQICEKLKSSPKKLKFVSILLGQEDAQFTQWLREQKLCRVGEDNVDVQTRLNPKDFNRVIARFLNVALTKLEHFLNSLRSRLALA